MLKKKLFFPTILFALILLGAGCAKNKSSSEQFGNDRPKIRLGTGTEECRNLDNRTITASFPSDIPPPSSEWGEWRVEQAVCHDVIQGSRESFDYGVTWYGKKKEGKILILREYQEMVKNLGWEVIWESSGNTFKAQKDGGNRTLTFWLGTGQAAGKSKIFPEANLKFEILHRQFR